MPNDGFAVDHSTALNGSQGIINHNQLLMQRGTTASRPAAASGDNGNKGMEWWSTDDETLYRSDGTTWVTIIGKDLAVGTASLRTLGAGAQQAAVGNHSTH